METGAPEKPENSSCALVVFSKDERSKKAKVNNVELKDFIFYKIWTKVCL